MFGRIFRIRLVKRKANPSVDYKDVATVITKKVVTVLVVYVGADTIRRVIVKVV